MQNKIIGFITGLAILGFAGFLYSAYERGQSAITQYPVIETIKIEEITTAPVVVSPPCPSNIPDAKKISRRSVNQHKESIACAGRTYQERFVNKIRTQLKNVDTRGIPHALIIAQAVLETGYGKKMMYNNLFCMRGRGPAGHYRHGDHDYVKGRKVYKTYRFKAYHNMTESIQDLVKWYANKTWYDRDDGINEFLNKLGRSNYASDPQYISKLRGIIRKYDL